MQRYWIVPSLVIVLGMALQQPLHAEDHFPAAPGAAVQSHAHQVEATLTAIKPPDKKTRLKQMILLWLLASQPGK